MYKIMQILFHKMIVQPLVPFGMMFSELTLCTRDLKFEYKPVNPCFNFLFESVFLGLTAENVNDF